MFQPIWSGAALAAVVGVSSLGGPVILRPTAYYLQEHVTARGEQKCRAFRRVSRDTRAMQKAQGGGLSPQAQQRLEQELQRARTMPPASLTARRCGVAL